MSRKTLEAERNMLINESRAADRKLAAFSVMAALNGMMAYIDVQQEGQTDLLNGVGFIGFTYVSVKSGLEAVRNMRQITVLNEVLAQDELQQPDELQQVQFHDWVQEADEIFGYRATAQL